MLHLLPAHFSHYFMALGRRHPLQIPRGKNSTQNARSEASGGLAAGGHSARWTPSKEGGWSSSVSRRGPHLPTPGGRARLHQCCCQEHSPTKMQKARSQAWAATSFLPGAATSHSSPQLKCSCSSQSPLSAQTALIASECHGPDPSAGFV